MPTIISHAAVPLALGLALGTRHVPRRLVAAGVIASMLPDLDVLAFRLNIAYSDTFGHRGFTHSIAFAMFVGFIALSFARSLRASRTVVLAFVGLSSASHGVLDMFTNGGHGVALWWPLSDERLFASWQVIEASPLSIRRLLGGRGMDVLQSEVLWIWLPAALVCAAGLLVRRLLNEDRFRAT